MPVTMLGAKEMFAELKSKTNYAAVTIYQAAQMLNCRCWQEQLKLKDIVLESGCTLLRSQESWEEAARQGRLLTKVRNCT